MGEANLCGYHEDHKNRIKRCEDDIQTIFTQRSSDEKSKMAFFVTAALALVGMIFQLIMSFLARGGN